MQSRTKVLESRPAWHVMDAEGKTLGRISSEIAVILQGKHKPSYVSYRNTGDYVIVVNAEKVRVTGKKLDQKMYHRHSGYPGGLKSQTLSRLLEKTPTRALKQAVKGMLPKNKLGRRMLSRLKLYAGPEHPHQAQVNARPEAQAGPAVQPIPAAGDAEFKPDAGEVNAEGAPEQQPGSETEA